MHILFITLSLLCHTHFMVIDTITPLNSKVYVVDLNKVTNNHPFGYLQEINDSGIKITTNPIRYGTYSVGNLMQFKDINDVTVHRKGSVGRGVLFGIIGGIVVGGIFGAIAYRPCTGGCFLDFGVGASIAAGSILGILPGGLIGALLGSKKHKYSVNKSKEGFDNMRSRIQNIYGMHKSNPNNSN